MTFKSAVLGAQGIRAMGFRRAQGNQHCAKFESHTNRVTFETNAISITSSIHALYHSSIVIGIGQYKKKFSVSVLDSDQMIRKIFLLVFIGIGLLVKNLINRTLCLCNIK